MRQDEVIPYPAIGEFYAILAPHALALGKCIHADFETHSCWTFTVWAPFGRDQWNFVPPVPIRKLWYSRNLWLREDEIAQFKVGAVYLAKKPERLFFIGPLDEEQRKHAKTTVRILADWDVGYDVIGNFSDEKVLLYQAGPDRAEDDDQFETRYDKATR